MNIKKLKKLKKLKEKMKIKKMIIKYLIKKKFNLLEINFYFKETTLIQINLVLLLIFLD